ncbi:Extracellular superoxide dismutase [Cu-Zn] [Merluccius polli]|uniref:Superoxide dismutase [Cu-Zn] n=1 Tax=Merluccius polli TaxID=89951 RepID=A0AA47MF02_MERPO|nr:Extracellular superoxide dismutase [Cu-Zn] [Merluccius polli]
MDPDYLTPPPGDVVVSHGPGLPDSTSGSERPALCISLLVLLVQLQATLQACDDAAALPELSQYNDVMYAACRVKPSSGLAVGLPRVHGHVLFKQELPQGPLNVYFYMNGFRAEGAGDAAHLRAIHIHQFGDIGEGCGATGGHYNPYGAPHPAHPGDFGNFAVRDGKIVAEKESANATLSGPLSVIGRAVVLHQEADDLGQGSDAASTLHGNAGTRLACCVIGLSSDTLWKKYR